MIMEFHSNSKSRKTLFRGMDRHFQKTFTERGTLENPFTNSKTGHPQIRPLYRLHPTKAAHRFHSFRNSKTAKRNLWKKSLINTRLICLKLEKNDKDDYVTFAGIENQEHEKSKLNSLTENQFKYLVFITELMSELQWYSDQTIFQSGTQ